MSKCITGPTVAERVQAHACSSASDPPGRSESGWGRGAPERQEEWGWGGPGSASASLGWVGDPSAGVGEARSVQKPLLHAALCAPSS